ncbi:sugar 3,4-ketoisomerase [Rufibacter roseolus]|uniref:sugar 3,4-ketoisomerase n=1 Tax=Rufibacter roseolus TaxID=2817375 RepID=UPI001B308DE1|nr:FdtA/QdtA family cupin domain-containing protein [Rufibacter roseolus]
MIEFPVIGSLDIGFISVAENNNLIPFEVKRVFWTYGTPEPIVRGRHAHHETKQIIIAVTGRILVTTEQANGEVNVFVLDKPNQGLYVPPSVWHTMQYTQAAVQMVLASTLYSESDYIREYTKFKAIWSKA